MVTGTPGNWHGAAEPTNYLMLRDNPLNPLNRFTHKTQPLLV